MMEKKITFIMTLFAILLASLIALSSCSSKNVNALVIILGRHANANAFDHDILDELSNYISNSLKSRQTRYGGFIGIITSEGTPRRIAIFDDFEVDEESDVNTQLEQDIEDILFIVQNVERTKAITPENDLLRAINDASNLFDVFKRTASRNGQRIKNQKLVILDTGIVTQGPLNFTSHDIDNFYFHVSDEEIKQFAETIAERLHSNRFLPNLKDVDITFIGLGDVAPPQRELSPNIQNGIGIIWKTILSKANANTVTIAPYISSRMPNSIDSGFPEVRPIEFFDEYGWPIYIEFLFNEPQRHKMNSDPNEIFERPQEALLMLNRFADTIIRYINSNPNPDVKIYLVGSESKNRSYTGVWPIGLSDRRANRIMNDLAERGVPRDRMEAFGLAVYLPRRENDWHDRNVCPLGEDGVATHIEMFCVLKGKQNQKVVIIPNDIKNVAFLNEVESTRNRLYDR